jgi:hypothetical protein
MFPKPTVVAVEWRDAEAGAAFVVAVRAAICVPAGCWGRAI